MDPASLNLLQEREKQILRLIAKGYDTKAVARELSVTGNVVNERLREVRKKLSVTSSREAARHLASAEEQPHKKFGDKQFGIVNASAPPHPAVLPAGRTGGTSRDRTDTQNDAAKHSTQFRMLATALSLPLRATEDRGNELSKSQRLVAIVEVAVKLVVAVAIVFFIAAMVNSIIINALK